MARRRYISTDISVDERVAELADKAGALGVLLYTWMIAHADDDATIHGSPREIKLRVIPGVPCTVSDVETALEAMVEVGLVEWDRRANVVGFPPGSFYKYQTYIGEDKRRKVALAEYLGTQAGNGLHPRTSAENSGDQRTSAEISGDQRRPAGTSVSPSPSPSPREICSSPCGDGGDDATAPSGDSGDSDQYPGQGVQEEARKSSKHKGGYSPEAKAVADRLKQDLLERGQVLPRDWHLKAYAVAQRLLANGVTVQEIDETREWCWSNPYWAARLDSMYVLADALNERRRKASVQARDAPTRGKTTTYDPYVVDLAKLRNELMGGASDADTGNPHGPGSRTRSSADSADLPERDCGRSVLPVA